MSQMDELNGKPWSGNLLSPILDVLPHYLIGGLPWLVGKKYAAQPLAAGWCVLAGDAISNGISLGLHKDTPIAIDETIRIARNHETNRDLSKLALDFIEGGAGFALHVGGTLLAARGPASARALGEGVEWCGDHLGVLSPPLNSLLTRNGGLPLYGENSYNAYSKNKPPGEGRLS